MRHIKRKSAPAVVQGRVQKKNNWEINENDYYNVAQPLPVVHRQRPGACYRHVLRQKDIHLFINLLPDWKELSRGLNAIVLAPGDPCRFGYHVPGVVHVCAWPAELSLDMWPEYYQRDKGTLDRLSVPCVVYDSGAAWCEFTENTVRGFQLLDVLLHELGHHHDRMTTRSQFDCCRGEPYAEDYARRYADAIWQRYLSVFQL